MRTRGRVESLSIQRRRVRVRRFPTRYKVLAGVALLTVGSITASYALAARDCDAVESIANGMIALLGANITAILGANTVDHWSANRYGVDLETENGEEA